MKLVLLGTSSPSAVAHRAQSSYLVETDDSVILFDHGPGAFVRLLEAGYTSASVTHVFLSHLHFDHCHDLVWLLHNRWNTTGGLRDPVEVFGPPGTQRYLERLFGTDGAYAPDIRSRIEPELQRRVHQSRGGSAPRPWINTLATELPAASTVVRASWCVQAAEVPHFQPYLDSLAYRFEHNGSSVVYTGDVHLPAGLDHTADGLAGLRKLAQDADILIHYLSGRRHIRDVSLDPPVPAIGADHHLFAQLAEDARVGTLISTHHNAALDAPGLKEKILAETARHYSGTVVWGEDLMIIDTVEKRLMSHSTAKTVDELNSPSPPRGVHLVGSLPVENANAAFRMAGARLGCHLHRVPDGETADRSMWIRWQYRLFAENPALEGTGRPAASGPFELLALRAGDSGKAIQFSDLGYATSASASYREFRRLREHGDLPRHLRFQVGLPSPLGPVTRFVQPTDRDQVEAAYSSAMSRELERICASIPPHDLAVQFELVWEFKLLAGRCGHAYPDLEEALSDRLRTLTSTVPDDVEVGAHLCYGDGFRGDYDPRALAWVATHLAAPRQLSWLHIPVPATVPAPFFPTLRNAGLGGPRELYFGMVHGDDDAAKVAARVRAASECFERFGVASVCGLGRRSPSEAERLLDLCTRASQPIIRAG